MCMWQPNDAVPSRKKPQALDLPSLVPGLTLQAVVATNMIFCVGQKQGLYLLFILDLFSAEPFEESGMA